MKQVSNFNYSGFIITITKKRERFRNKKLIVLNKRAAQ